MICCTTCGASSQRSVDNDIERARHAVSALVGRDTDRMDGPACRRAAVESLSENLTDGFVSPMFWYVLAGVPGLVLFKIVSTMDSMVGYKTPQYLRFGWCGARLDDVMNYLPARLTWFVIVCVAAHRTGLLRPKGLADRSWNSTPCCWDRTPAGARRRLPERWSGESLDRSGSTEFR